MVSLCGLESLGFGLTQSNLHPKKCKDAKISGTKPVVVAISVTLGKLQGFQFRVLGIYIFYKGQVRSFHSFRI